LPDFKHPCCLESNAVAVLLGLSARKVKTLDVEHQIGHSQAPLPGPVLKLILIHQFNARLDVSIYPLLMHHRPDIQNIFQSPGLYADALKT
jgi:hypothetical protein